MTPSAAKASYRRLIGAVGRSVTLRRENASGPPTDVVVRAKQNDLGAPAELAGSVLQKQRQFIILEEDVTAGAFPVPFRERFDRLISQEGQSTIQIAKARWVGNEIVAYDITTQG